LKIKNIGKKMTELRLVRYSEDYFNRWNEFVESSNNGTIFHRLDFLAYHKEKFSGNEHHLIILKGDQIFAVFPMAVFDTGKGRIARSPYGGSYGGFVTRKPTNYYLSNKIVTLLIEYLKEIAVSEIFVTLPPAIFETIHSDTLFFSFLENGFLIVNSDVSSIVALENWRDESKMFSSREKNIIRKTKKAEVILKSTQQIDDFWNILGKNYQKIGVQPTHSFEEWKYLCEKFPDKFCNDVAYLANKPIAAIGHIQVNKFTDTTFYLCSDHEYNKTQALTKLIYSAILQAKRKNFKWFNLGTSSLNMIAYGNIFRFKESFGTIGIFRHTLKLKI
jgi:hypothetical protein